MKSVRVGIIGTGLAAKEIHLPILKQMLSDKLEIVAVFSRSTENAEAYVKELGANPKIYTNYEDMLSRSDIDAVIIAVPISFNYTIARAALQQGKHVFLEIPISDNSKDGEALIKLAKEMGKVFLVGEYRRYQKRFYEAHRLANSGVIGDPKIYHLNDLHFTNPNGKYAQTLWRQKGDHHGGYLLDGGAHIVAGMRAMVGSKVKSIHALTASLNPELLGRQADTMFINLLFENGMIGQMALGYATMDKDARRPKIYGEKGTVVMFGDRFEIWPTDAEKPVEVIQIDSLDEGIAAEFDDFYYAITEDRGLRSKPEEALIDLRIIEAGLESAATGAVINL